MNKPLIIKFSIIFGVVFLAISTLSQIQNKKNKIDKLQIQYSDFIGKEVYELLLNDSIRFFKKFTFFDNKPGSLSGAIVVVDDNTFLEIFVSEFKYLVKFNEQRNWDKILFYKEIISRIKIYKNNICILDTDLPIP